MTYLVAAILLIIGLIGIRLLYGTRDERITLGGWKNEQVAFPIKGLELPRGSTIVEVREMTASEDSVNGIVVRFDCRQSHKDVYTHVDSSLVNLGFKAMPHSQSFSKDMFQRGYYSTKSNFSVIFVQFGNFSNFEESARQVKYSEYVIGVYENSLPQEP